jgi:drug/metabolite transporter (DMT)-like permease
MIQRIQSVFLLLAAIASALQFVMPYLTGSSVQPAFADGQFDASDYAGLSTIWALGTALALAAIFLFGKRPLQSQFARAGIGISGGGLAAMIWQILWIFKQESVDAALQYGAGIALAPIALILFLLANRAIRRDEQLVKSMDRLR